MALACHGYSGLRRWKTAWSIIAACLFPNANLMPTSRRGQHFRLASDLVRRQQNASAPNELVLRDGVGAADRAAMIVAVAAQVAVARRNLIMALMTACSLCALNYASAALKPSLDSNSVPPTNPASGQTPRCRRPNPGGAGCLGQMLPRLSAQLLLPRRSTPSGARPTSTNSSPGRMAHPSKP